MTTIDIKIDDNGRLHPLRVAVQRMYNFGSATRAAETAVAHQHEVAKEGIHIAFDVPAPRIYPIAPHALTTGDRVFVHGERTSGEVEIAILVADQVYVGVASDHTDRDLERVSIPWSKQACPNVLAPVMWPLKAVHARWDDCVLRSRVDGRPYQEVGASAFLHPEDVLRTLHERVSVVPARDYLVLCGTIVSLDKALGFGKVWEFELDQPQGARRIRHRYAVHNMFDEIREGFRVPVRNPRPAQGAAS
jgi:4-hydroxyphenylacetate 3-monooxygenase